MFRLNYWIVFLTFFLFLILACEPISFSSLFLLVCWPGTSLRGYAKQTDRLGRRLPSYLNFLFLFLFHFQSELFLT